MTQTPYRPATSPASRNALLALKVLVTAGLVLLACGAAFVVAVIATILYSGCFIECGDAQELEGLLVYALALGLLVTGPVLARVMWRRTATVRGAAIWAAAVLGVPTVLAVWVLPPFG